MCILNVAGIQQTGLGGFQDGRLIESLSRFTLIFFRKAYIHKLA